MGYSVAISIAVAAPAGLDWLPGAINGAKAFHGWASRAVAWAPDLYVTKLITDENGPVTTDSLRAEIQPLLHDKKIDRLIVYFAGHGSSIGMEDFWLLTNWDSDSNEAINVAYLRRFLDFYQPAQIVLIGDACRTSGKAFNHLLGSPIVERPPIDWVRAAEVEVFKAASLGDPAYMKNDPDPAKARCLFTELLVKALEGQEPAALEERLPDRVVSSGQLKRFLEAAVNEAGGQLQLTVRPEIQSGFTYPRDIYLTAVPAPPVAAGAPPLPDALVEAREIHRRMQTGMAKMTIPGRSPEIRRRTPPPDPGPSAGAVAAELEAVAADSQATSDRVLARLADETARDLYTTHAETGAGVSVVGMDAEMRAYSPWAKVQDAGAPGEGAGRWYALHDVDDSILTRPATVGLRLENDLWTFGAVFPEMLLTLSVDDEGVEAAVHRSDRNRYPPGDYARTEQAIADMLAGRLSGQNAYDVAAELRQDKHADPVRGVIAAYLYDRVGDIEAIRKTAWFYTEVGQPIPFDIALLANVRGTFGPEGWRVDLPATEAREPLGAVEQSVHDFFRATGAVQGARVAGGFPMLRQGWGLLPLSLLPLSPELPGLAHGLTNAPFTTFHREQGEALARLVNTGAV